MGFSLEMMESAFCLILDVDNIDIVKCFKIIQITWNQNIFTVSDRLYSSVHRTLLYITSVTAIQEHCHRSVMTK